MLSNVPRLRRSLMYRGRAGNSVSINFGAAVPPGQYFNQRYVTNLIRIVVFIEFAISVLKRTSLLIVHN